MKIRRAEEKDIPRLNALLYQVCQVHADGRPDIFIGGTKKYTDDALKELLHDETRPVFAAVDEQDCVMGYAFCIYEIVPEDSPNMVPMRSLYIDDICVDETMRGQHIGTAIYEYVKEWAKENGFYRITLNVWCLNGPAMKFYEHMGMKPLKVVMEDIL